MPFCGYLSNIPETPPHVKADHVNPHDRTQMRKIFHNQDETIAGQRYIKKYHIQAKRNSLTAQITDKRPVVNASHSRQNGVHGQRVHETQHVHQRYDGHRTLVAHRDQIAELQVRLIGVPLEQQNVLVRLPTAMHGCNNAVLRNTNGIRNNAALPQGIFLFSPH